MQSAALAAWPAHKLSRDLRLTPPRLSRDVETIRTCSIRRAMQALSPVSVLYWATVAGRGVAAQRELLYIMARGAGASTALFDSSTFSLLSNKS